MPRLKLKNNLEDIEVNIPRDNFLYYIEPLDPDTKDIKEELIYGLNNPVSSPPLERLVRKGMKIAVLADDITRPTPQKDIIPILLDRLNDTGIEDRDITIIIALGTHRYMERKEIIKRFTRDIYQRVRIINHEWKDSDTFETIGHTKGGIPVIINRLAASSDYIIGIGTIAPHDLAGYSGGCKIIQPGISSPETTRSTHLLASSGDTLGNLADAENDVRKMIEEMSQKAGLGFIINTVLDRYGNTVKAVCGHPVKAHREGVSCARMVYERPIPALADIVIVNSYPADLDYWQAIKPLLFARKGLKEGGTIILAGSLMEGISPSHPHLGKYGRRTPGEINRLYMDKKIEDGTCAAALIIHAKCREKAKIICVSRHLGTEEKTSLGLIDAADIDDALGIAFSFQGKDAKVGVIEYGGDVVPVMDKKRWSSGIASRGTCL